MRHCNFCFLNATLIALLSFGVSAQDCESTYKTYELLELHHIEPRTFNDSFSADVFDLFIEELNPQGVLLTQTDVDAIAKHRLKLNEYIDSKSCVFIDEFAELYVKRLEFVENTINALLDEKMNLNGDETISLVKDGDGSIIEDDEKLVELWRKYLKYSVLYDIFNEDSTISVSEASNKVDETIEKIRKQKLERIDRIKNYKDGIKTYLINQFNNCVASVFDPHSMYMTNQMREAFQEGTSTEALYYGLEFDENHEGEVIIKRMVPGGAAWNCNELNNGDVVLDVTFTDGEKIDLALNDPKEFYAAIGSNSSKSMNIRIRNTLGKEKAVFLRKEVAAVEDNIIKSFVLNGDKKIGYLLLPSFYTDWSDLSNPIGCANDVAKEILKLKREGIEGIILDLRYNGGGSMMEASNLAGVFINEGALFINQNKERPQLMKDRNRGTVYSGPLTVMVNTMSASASEVVAATLQDYNRAVIVGSRTYGKATGQRIFPLSTNPGMESDAFVKITVSKLYRINQETNQFKGVIPDIVLEDVYESLELGERFTPHALRPSTIDKVVTYNKLKELPIAELEKKSEERTAANTQFKEIEELMNVVEEYNSQKKILVPLNINKYHEYLEEQDHWGQWEELAADDENLFSIENDSYLAELLSIDAYRKELNDELRNEIAEDIYLKECYRIMLDLISFEQ